MKRVLSAALLLPGLLAVAVAQQNTNGNIPARPAPPANTSNPRNDERPYSASVTGKVLKVSRDNNLIVVAGPNEQPLEYVVDETTRKKADKKTELAGKKDISLADYKPGQIVKITFRISDNKVFVLRLKLATN